MRTRYIANTLNLHCSTSLYGPIVFNPIFTPIFTAVFGGATLGATGITLASIGAAIATTSLTLGVLIR